MAQQLFDAFDENHSGTISLLEFLNCFKPDVRLQVDNLVERIARTLYASRQPLKQLFFKMDVSGDGLLQREEFQKGMRCLAELEGTHLSEEEVDLVITHLDTDADGTISWNEFLAAFQVVARHDDADETPTAETEAEDTAEPEAEDEAEIRA